MSDFQTSEKIIQPLSCSLAVVHNRQLSEKSSFDVGDVSSVLADAHLSVLNNVHFVAIRVLLDDLLVGRIACAGHGVDQPLELVLAQAAHKRIRQKSVFNQFLLLFTLLDLFESPHALFSLSKSLGGDGFSQIVVGVQFLKRKLFRLF